MRILARFLLVAALSSLALVAVVALLAPQVMAVIGATESSEEPIDLAPLSQRSVVLASDGSRMAVLHAEENRSPVPLAEVSDHLVTAILAVEDQDFWSHDGVNVRAIARALLTNVSAGATRQGGSTITQQLVKTVLLTPERELGRKVKEALLARQLEEQLSKEEILEQYLNTVYFGNGAYGAQAAAEVYFGTSASQLTVPQAALLAGLIRNPVGYDPLRFPDLARSRRDLVLRTMADLELITADEAAAYQHEPIPDHAFTPREPPRNYFLEEVKQVLLDDERLGATAAERYNAVFKGGLTIRTTLNTYLQTLAEQAVVGSLPEQGLDHVDSFGRSSRFTSALVAVEPGSGAVRAMHSAEDFAENQYRLATQGLRQPGSAFKPIVLAAALEAGYSPNDVIDASGPCTFTASSRWLQEPWKVDNYGDARGGGTVSLASATHRSLNCAYARLALHLGPDKIVEFAKSIGFSTDIPTVPSIALGAGEVHPIDMAAAYATFANDGVYHAPFFIEEVRDRAGNVLFTGGDEGRPVMSQDSARLVNDVLQGVVTRGTGTRARLTTHEVAGKTGTTQNWEDAWFVGYTPRVATAVWMGSPLGRVSMRNVGGIRVTGGSYPATIWKAFMDPALRDFPRDTFADPPSARSGRSITLGVDVDEARRRPRRTTTTTTRPTSSAAPTTTSAPTGGGGGDAEDDGEARSAGEGGGDRDDGGDGDREGRSGDRERGGGGDRERGGGGDRERGGGGDRERGGGGDRDGDGGGRNRGGGGGRSGGGRSGGGDRD